jgi:hypothetical protein
MNEKGKIRCVLKSLDSIFSIVGVSTPGGPWTDE